MPGILQACLQLKLHSDQELMVGRDSRDNEKKIGFGNSYLPRLDLMTFCRV